MATQLKLHDLPPDASIADVWEPLPLSYFPKHKSKYAPLTRALASLSHAEISDMRPPAAEMFPDYRASVFGDASRLAQTDAAVQFGKLVEQWRTGIEYANSILEVCTHIAYQRIIGMGRIAVPFILRELKTTPDHWFWALKAITGEDPVPPSSRGNLLAMTEAWLSWGARNGYEF